MGSWSRTFLWLAFVGVFVSPSLLAASPRLADHAEKKAVKVFILSGQSNMVGWSHVRTLPRLGDDPRHGALFSKLTGRDGRWIERDDVFVDSTVDGKTRKGRLSVGYGGGGELVGFVWVQGWNEMFAGDEIQEEVYAEYPGNLAHLVEDLREEFDTPSLYTIVGELGIQGDAANDRIRELRAAQAAIMKQPALRGSVEFVRNAHLWDASVDAAFDRREKVRRDLFREMEPKIRSELESELDGGDQRTPEKRVRDATNDAVEKIMEYALANEEFKRVGSHWECHYHGNAKMYCLIGQALAEAVGKLDSHLPR